MNILMDLTRYMRYTLKTAFHTSWLITINSVRVDDDYAELVYCGPSHYFLEKQRWINAVTGSPVFIRDILEFLH